MSRFFEATEYIRSQSANDNDRGRIFEKLVKVFLENDPTQVQQFSRVWLYKDWARDNPQYSKIDIGIDLVAKLRDEEGYCSIQCKFYSSDHAISKSDLDSFISASNTNDFKRLLLIDTSNESLGKNAQSVFNNLTQTFNRIQSSELEESRIDWMTFIRMGDIKKAPKKEIRDHQLQALNSVREGFQENDRGKLIMACGTGKTFTSLRIAEDIAGKGKTVLYMVPSLALMSQTIREWKNDSLIDFSAFSACSDIKVGKRKSNDDAIEIDLSDLAFPATTNAQSLVEKIKESDKSKMTVIFSTYQSINVISTAQKEYGLDEIDLIICDEAHRTTGATLVGEDESKFVQIHSNENVRGKKRLYMTATPRIFGDSAKKKASEDSIELASMDNEEQYGKVLFHRGFGWAVQNNLLTDYKVIVLAMDEKLVSYNAQKSLSSGSQLVLDDATKIIGCYKALAKVGLSNDKKSLPMKTGLAFCQNIAVSKVFAEEFSKVVEEYSANEKNNESSKSNLKVEVKHVDGTFNAEKRNENLNWLKEKTSIDQCRILTNAKCLSEGVDVPSLDSIMFIHPRKSQIDVVQSVGRVMRKAEGKDLGYVIIPIAVSPGVNPEKALNDNKKYQVVWQILNALRAHDERLDRDINRISLGEDISDKIQIINGGITDEISATTSVVEKISKKSKKKIGDDESNIGEEENDSKEEDSEQISIVFTDLSQAIKAKIVKNCGTRDYWETWARNITEIANAHINRINAILINKESEERELFDKYLEEIRDDLNPDISESDAVEMLAQHIITRPVFDSLFKDKKFTANNAVSIAMEKVLDKLYTQKIDNETRDLEKFYKSVQERADGIITAKGRQTLIKDLYNRFFSAAFPKMSKRLGIVYTPVEVVDFILKSVEYILNSEFNSSIGEEGVQIIDPFAGTGTFITRLLQLDLISYEKLFHKYRYEIHANEIVLLAYYVACINIESVFQDYTNENQFESFNGMVLTDTFQLYEQEKDLIADLLPDNSERRKRQKEAEISVVIGNPPYSSGQNAANDNDQNIKYEKLDSKIEKTYCSESKATNQNSLYDSYIRAFRWASDRVKENAVIGFITNGGWIDSIAHSGFRKCLSDEFDKIYVFHLRGNARTSGEMRRKEGGNVFDVGSRAPIALTFLIKKKKSNGEKKILYYDIGDYLKREDKLSIISNFESIAGIIERKGFTEITPDAKNDWINKGNTLFERYLSLGAKKDANKFKFFKNYSLGLKTSRDSWNYNSSKDKLIKNVKSSIDFYNSELQRFRESGIGKKAIDFVEKDSTKISWDRSQINNLEKGKNIKFNQGAVKLSLYRPFYKTWLYSDSLFNNCVYQIPIIFPNEIDINNFVIAVTGTGAKSGLSTLITDLIPDQHLLDSYAQCFPYKIFDSQKQFFSNLNNQSYESGVNEFVVSALSNFYKVKINEIEVMRYIYGILHSEFYKKTFKNNLSKEIPRIPFSRNVDNFFDFVNAGEKLIQLHMNYETVEKYPAKLNEGTLNFQEIVDPISFFKVEKMRFETKEDLTTIIYNQNIKITEIPKQSWDYIVSGKPALKWVMERQGISRDSSSGIINDTNDFALETMNSPSYPLDLFLRVITVSLETLEIIEGMPKLNEENMLGYEEIFSK